MKTLIFNGSPRPQGSTAGLIDLLVSGLQGEYKIVDAYRCDISPCVDCRFCWKQAGCAIQDDMQEIYQYIEECDNIVIASPIYFSELTGKLLDVGSRLQTYFSARFIRKSGMVKKPKKGAVILVAGGNGKPDKPYGTARELLHNMNCRDILPVVYSRHTDQRPAAEDEACLESLNNVIDYFNTGAE